MSGGILYVISLKAVSSASYFSRSSAVGGKVPSSAPRACSAGVASLAAAVRTCGTGSYITLKECVNEFIDDLVTCEKSEKSTVIMVPSLGTISKGTDHNISIPYTAQQNEVVKRLNKLL
ncbi:hypothetical protein LXL04_033373 [Taraxacum kok-saghyz]